MASSWTIAVTAHKDVAAHVPVRRHQVAGAVSDVLYVVPAITTLLSLIPLTLLTKTGPGADCAVVAGVVGNAPVHTGLPRLQFEIVTPLIGLTVGAGVGPL